MVSRYAPGALGLNDAVTTVPFGHVIFQCPLPDRSTKQPCFFAFFTSFIMSAL